MEKRKRGRSIDGKIYDFIRVKIADEWGATQIFNHLTKEGVFPDYEIPTQRTIQRIVRDEQAKDISGEWSISDSPEDARIVLDVLAERISRGINEHITKTEADWIIKVRKAAPDAPNNIVFLVAFSYVVKENADYDDRALDRYLALTPWKDKDSLRRYKRAVAQKTIPRVPMWSILVDELFKTILPDPRFGRDNVAINKFEKDIYELSAKGESLDAIADRYNIDPEDIDDIIQKYEKGDTK